MIRITRSTIAAAAAIGFIFSATPSFAVPLTAEEILQQFNLVVFGDLVSSSDVEGRTYVGGDLGGPVATYFTKGNEAPASALAALIVGGTVSSGPYQIDNGGSAVIGGDLDTQITLAGAGGVRYVAGDVNVVQPGDPASTVQGPVAIEDFETPLRQASGDLANLAANSAATRQVDKGIFTGTPDSNGLAVFWIDGGDFFDALSGVTELEFLVGGAGTIIINVSGSAIDIAAGFLGGIGESIASSLIWNFYEATDILIETAFLGSILAPNADLTNLSSIRGSVVANEFNQVGQIQLAPFAPSTDVPEPETALLLLPGLFGLIALGRMARRRRATIAD